MALGRKAVRTYVLFPPDLPKGEGGKSTSLVGGARSPYNPLGLLRRTGAWGTCPGTLPL